MIILVKNGHVIDKAGGIDGKFDILVEGDIIKSIAPGGKAGKKANSVVDASGMHVFPGLVDLHVHLREPGFTHKETIRTGTEAAVRGGFTSVCAMPNTSPVNDNPGTTDYMLRKVAAEGLCDVYPIGAITKEQKGEELAPLGLMNEEGCIAFSDDGSSVMNPLIMRRALEYSKAFGFPLISHCEDLALADGGVMNEGLMSFSMGLKGIPSASEEVMVHRDILLAELTGGRLHLAHISTEGSVRIIRQAKERGVKVTAETCPHYFTLTEQATEGFNTYAKVNPPLRTAADVEAIKQGIRDGTIDIIATDHAPHHQNEKMREFDMAPPGMSGLETALALSLDLVRDGVIGLGRLVSMMTSAPARIAGIDKGSLKEGGFADLVVVDLEREFEVVPGEFASLGKNTPFAGYRLKGKPTATVAGGRLYQWG
jgi:dihydroorotase